MPFLLLERLDGAGSWNALTGTINIKGREQWYQNLIFYAGSGQVQGSTRSFKWHVNKEWDDKCIMSEESSREDKNNILIMVTKDDGKNRQAMVCNVWTQNLAYASWPVFE